jgi:hypothetical protein
LRESDEAADKETAKQPTKRHHLLRESEDATDKVMVKATYKAASPLHRKLSRGKQSNPQIYVIS